MPDAADSLSISGLLVLQHLAQKAPDVLSAQDVIRRGKSLRNYVSGIMQIGVVPNRACKTHHRQPKKKEHETWNIEWYLAAEGNAARRCHKRIQIHGCRW